MSLFCWTQRKIFWRMWETEQFWGTIDFHSNFFSTMEVNGAPKQPDYKLSSKYLPLCSAEQRHSYRFGTTWGWVNDDRIFIFGWTIPLRFWLCHISEGQVINIKNLLQAYVSVPNKVTDQLFYLLANAVFTLIWQMLIWTHV